MAYTPTNWKNREVERPRTFRQQSNSDGTVTLTPEEGKIIEAGTPIVADTMNKIEQALVEAHKRHKLCEDDGTGIYLHERDLNTVIDTGFYTAFRSTNTPTLKGTVAYMAVIAYDAQYVLQQLYDCIDGKMYIRCKVSSTAWTKWEPIATGKDLEAVKQRHKLCENDGKAINVSNKDLNTIIETGFYMGAEMKNAPTTDWYYVEVINHNSKYALQKITRFHTSEMHMRGKVNGVWESWEPIVTGKDLKSRELSKNTDLNNLKEEGEYYSAYNAVVATFKNRPDDNACYIKVSRHAGFNQTWYSFLPDDIRIFTRNWYSGSWGKWHRIPVANANGALDITGDANMLNLYGTTHGYITFLKGGARTGYIGAGDPAAPDNITLSTDHGGLWLHAGNGVVHVNGRNILAEIDNIKAAPNWITPTLLNGVSSAYDYTVKYCKDALGWVHIEGTIGTPGKHFFGKIFDLPSGYRPRGFVDVHPSTNRNTNINIDPNGEVILSDSEPDRPTAINLGCISFYAGN